MLWSHTFYCQDGHDSVRSRRRWFGCFLLRGSSIFSPWVLLNLIIVIRDYQHAVPPQRDGFLPGRLSRGCGRSGLRSWRPRQPLLDVCAGRIIEDDVVAIPIYKGWWCRRIHDCAGEAQARALLNVEVTTLVDAGVRVWKKRSMKKSSTSPNMYTEDLRKTLVKYQIIWRRFDWICPTPVLWPRWLANALGEAGLCTHCLRSVNVPCPCQTRLPRPHWWTRLRYHICQRPKSLQ